MKDLLARLGRLREATEAAAWAIIATCTDDQLVDTVTFAVRHGAVGEGAEYNDAGDLIRFDAAPPDDPGSVFETAAALGAAYAALDDLVTLAGLSGKLEAALAAAHRDGGAMLDLTDEEAASLLARLEDAQAAGCMPPAAAELLNTLRASLTTSRIGRAAGTTEAT